MIPTVFLQPFPTVVFQELKLFKIEKLRQNKEAM